MPSSRAALADMTISSARSGSARRPLVTVTRSIEEPSPSRLPLKTGGVCPGAVCRWSGTSGHDVGVDPGVVADLFDVRQPSDLRDDGRVVGHVRPDLWVVERGADLQVADFVRAT